MKNSPIGCRFTRKIPSLGDEKFLLGHNPVTENSSAPPPRALKPVILRLPEQWKNLKEYFIIFLPWQKNFKREIECTIRYKRIAENLKSTLTPAYLAFVAFVSQDFESFLLTFQRKEPMIHIPYTAMGSFLSKMLTKFVLATVFMDEAGTPEHGMKSIEYLASIDVSKGKNQRSLKSIYIGTKTKLVFSKWCSIRDKSEV